MSDYILGVDVSRHQGTMDWKKCWDAGARFAAIRFTVGDYYVDPNCFDWVVAAKAEGFKTSIYCVSAPADGQGRRISGDEHLAWIETKFADVFGDDKYLDFPIIVDAELSRGQDMRWITTLHEKLLLGLCEFQGHDYPMVYTSPGWWNGNIYRSDHWKLYPLWVAHWTSASEPTLPHDWNKWALWQWTSKGIAANYGASSNHIDLNWWHPSYPFPNGGTLPPVTDKAWITFSEILATYGDETYSIENVELELEKV